MQQNGEEQSNRKIFLEMPDGVWIELAVVDKFHIQDLLSIAREECQRSNQVLKIFKEDELLRSSLTIRQEDLNEGQIFKAQTIKKQQPIFFKMSNSEPKEIIVDVETQKIADVVELIKRELGIPEEKEISASWNNKVLDQDRYFYEYQRIQYNQITLVEAEIPNSQVSNQEENQQIELTIQHEGDIFLKQFYQHSTIEEVCLDVKKKLNTSEMVNLYQNYRKLDKISKLSDFLNINQWPLIAQIQKKYFSFVVNYQGDELQVEYKPQAYIQEIQEGIRSFLNMHENIIFALYLNDIKLDPKLRLDEYYIDDKQKTSVNAKMEPSRYIFRLPEFQNEVQIQIEDQNITINDHVLIVKDYFQILDTNFSAYQGMNRLNLHMFIEYVQLKSNIITLWEDKQIEQDQKNLILITCNIIDLGEIHQIQINENKNIKSLETMIKYVFEINENIMFYLNKVQICSNQTIKELEITGQKELDCLILKESYDIQIRYSGVIKNLNVINSPLVSEIKERARLEFNINENVNLMVIQEQTIFIDDYKLDHYLIEQIIDIIPFEIQLNLLIYMNNITTIINLSMNYQNNILDLCQKLTSVYGGMEFNVYCDRLKQKKKKFLRELNYNNLKARQIKGSLQICVQIQDQRKVTFLRKKVNTRQIIGFFLIGLFKNINYNYLKELKLTVQNLILDLKKKFQSYLIQENDILEIQPPSMIYQFEIDGSQLDCQLFQEKLTFRIRILGTTTQITAFSSQKLSNVLYKLNFNNLNVKNISFQCNNKILDIYQTLSTLGIKQNDLVEVLENEFVYLKISINKKNPIILKINTLWNIQQLKDFVSQYEDQQFQNCRVYLNDKEIKEDIQLIQLQLNDGDLIEIFYKQKPSQQQMSCTQFHKTFTQEIDNPLLTVSKIQQQDRNQMGCKCIPHSACRCNKYSTIFTQKRQGQ